MVKTLVNNLFSKTKMRTQKFVSAVGLSALLLCNGYFSTNCKSPAGPEIPGTAPTAILSVSPDSGNAPLEVRVQLDGSPRDNITKYVLKIDSLDSSLRSASYTAVGSIERRDVFRRLREETRKESGREGIQTGSRMGEQASTSRDYGVQAKEIERFKAEVKGELSKKRAQTGSKIEEQTMTYEGTREGYETGIPKTGFEKMHEEGLSSSVQTHRTITAGTNADEEVVSDKPINITRVYDNLAKKDITISFTGEVTDKQGRKSSAVTKNVTVRPNEDVSILDFSEVNAEFDEEEKHSMTLPKKDTRGRDVEYISAKPLDEKTKVLSLENYVLAIRGEKDQIEKYEIELNFKNHKGVDDSQNLSGYLHDVLDVSGFLEDNENHFPVPGVVRVYDPGRKKLGEVPVELSGRFDKQIKQRVSELPDEIILQARSIDPAIKNNRSYVRTVKLPGKQDIRDFLMRVVPYSGLSQNSITPENFRRHMAEVLTGGYLRTPPTQDPINWNPIIYKWDFGEARDAQYSFKEVIISKTKPDLPPEEYFFTQETANYIRNRVLDANDIGSWFKGKISQIRIVDFYDHKPEIDKGLIAVYPYNGSLGGREDFSGDGYLDYGSVLINVAKGEGTIVGPALAHEFGHASGLHGHAWTIPGEMTIMWYDCRGSSVAQNYPRFADKKSSMAIYENTFIHGYGFLTHPESGKKNLLGLDDILGLKFYDD